MSARGATAAIGRGSAPGKMILVGEHAVVYGHSALAAALDRGVEVRLLPSSEGRYLVAPIWGLRCALAVDDARSSLSRSLARVWECVAPALAHGCLLVRSNLPLGVGLGSSAALAVASARALADAQGTTLDDAELTRVVLLAEREVHGNPSGVDQAAIIHGGIVAFTRSADMHSPPRVERLRTPTELRLVVAFEGAHVGTAMAVAAVRERRERWPRTVRALMGELGAIASDARASLVAGDVPALGEAMNWAHALLAALGVSSAPLDALVAHALEHGAVGAKLTGAGMGGAIVALVPGGGEAQRQLMLALRARGASAFPCTLAAALPANLARGAHAHVA